MATLKFKEPVTKDSTEVSKLELIKLINIYRTEPTITIDLLKQYMLEYIDNNYIGDSTKLKKAVDKVMHWNSYFILARLISNGWVLPSEYIIRLTSYLNTLAANSTEKVNSKKVINKVEKPVVKEENNYKDHLYLIEQYIDHKLYNNPSTFNYIVETQSTKIKECLDYIDNLIIIYKEDIKYKHISSNTFKLVNTLLESLKEIYTKSLSDSPKRQRPINKAKMCKSVKYSYNKIANIDKYCTPTQTVGKKKMFVFDEKKKTLFCFISSTGFTYSGTTLKGFTDKSFCIKIKDINLLSNSISSLNTYCTENEEKKKEVTTGRFNENMLILAVS